MLFYGFWFVFLYVVVTLLCKRSFIQLDENSEPGTGFHEGYDQSGLSLLHLAIVGGRSMLCSQWQFERFLAYIWGESNESRYEITLTLAADHRTGDTGVYAHGRAISHSLSFIMRHIDRSIHQNVARAEFFFEKACHIIYQWATHDIKVHKRVVECGDLNML